MIRIVPAPGSYISIGGNVSGGIANRVLFTDANGALAQSANLTYSEASSTPLLTVGSGNAGSAGFVIGKYTASGFGGLWSTAITLSSTNYTLLTEAGSNTYLNAASSLFLLSAGVTKVTIANAAGLGPSITAGTATSDLQALSATQTWNNAAVAFTHEKHLITDTASAAGSLAVAYFGGASASTILFSVDKSGVLQFGTTYSAGVVAATGTIQVKDATGTTYNVLVHT